MLSLELFGRTLLSKIKNFDTSINGASQVVTGRNKRHSGLEEVQRKRPNICNQELDDHCKNLCHQASVACLQNIHNHVLEYLDKNMRLHVDQDSSDSESDNDNDGQSRSSNCSYIDWIRQYHPENAGGEESDDERLLGNEIDLRFYLEDSEHRIIWNSYVDAFGCPELKVNPAHGLLQKQQHLRQDKQ
mmetsp:Transcript_10101/g.12754  ORF Transcript_10101/g.12754 Transcript_10101/m.12754 type:complete len:188 (+) Transcript_10101:167-730(+)